MRRISHALSPKTLIPASTSSIDVACTAGPFRCAWLAIIFLHGTHGAILLRAVYAQVRTLLSPDEVDANLRLTGKRFNPALFYVAIVMEVVFSTYHVVVLVQMARHSLRARALSLIDPDSDRTSSLTRLLSRSLRAMADSFSTTFARSSTALQRWGHLYGIRGPHFERAFHAKEVYEVFWESFQLYQCLYHVTHPVTGSLALAVLVLNCWTTPVIYVWFPHANHRATRFVLCLVVDAVLDFISSILIPYVTYLNYRMLLAKPQRHDAAWAFIVGTDLLQFTPTDVTGILARLLPSLSMVMNLAAIKPVIKRVSIDVVGPSAQILPQAPVDLPEATSATSATTLSVQHTRQPRWVRVLHACLLAVGVAGIVLVHIRKRDAHAEGLPHCRVVMRHWLVPRVPCAVLEVHCDETDDMAALHVLDNIDALALHALTFINCPSLTMPDAIRRFPNLNWLEVRNSTLVRWPLSAALTRTTSPRIGRLLFVETNFTEFPQALCIDRTTFPMTLLDITFSRTNLTTLPAELHRTWPQPMASIQVEHGQLTHVPSTLLAMETDVLSLAGNAIASVPQALFAGKTFTALSLSANPIEELPMTIDAPFHLRTVLHDSEPHGLWLVNTNVSSLPDWMEQDWTEEPLPNNPATSCLMAAVYATGSPVCTAHAVVHHSKCMSTLVCELLPQQFPSGVSADGFLFYRPD